MQNDASSQFVHSFSTGEALQTLEFRVSASKILLVLALILAARLLFDADLDACPELVGQNTSRPSSYHLTLTLHASSDQQPDPRRLPFILAKFRYPDDADLLLVLLK